MSNDIAERPDTHQAVTAHEAPAGSMLNFIAAALKDPGIDVAKLQALLDMQRQVTADDAKAQFNQAFLRLQRVLPAVAKKGALSHLKDQAGGKKVQTFARWEDINDAIRPHLDAEGFSLSFNTIPRAEAGGGIIVTAILRHSAGHQTETSIPIPLDASGGKNSIQGYGSALSYGKRYAATAALNIITIGEDDDGHRGGLRFITAEQAADLHALIAETGTDDARFCNTFSVAKIENLEEANYVPARNMLLAKRKVKP